MSYWFSCEHLRLEMRRRTAETTRTALIRWWKTWRICCQISLSSHLPPKRKSRHHLVCSHFPIFFIVHYKPASTRLTSPPFLYSICHLRCCNWEGQQVSQNEARCGSQRGEPAKGRVTGCPQPQSSSDPCPWAKKRASWKC